MIRLIALDLDGTLLDPAGRITQASKDAIARARAAGVRVVLNTGRPIQEAVWFAGEAGCDALLSCLGGAAVVDGVRGETRLLRHVPAAQGLPPDTVPHGGGGPDAQGGRHPQAHQ